MKNKRLGLFILAAVLVLALIFTLPGCQKVVNIPLALGWHRIPNLLVEPGPVKVGTGYPTTAQGSGDLFVTNRLEIDGDFDLDAGMAITLGADEKVLVDGDTTNQTQTAGAVDVNVGTTTADVNALNVGFTQDNGTAAATDGYAAIFTLTQNDADADMRGVSISAAATANAAAASYEYLIALDCAENTAAACTDGIIVTSSGTDTGLTDGLDVSASNIVNAVNVGSNLVLGGNSDYFQIGATDATFAVTRNDAGSVTFTGADNSSPAETIYDTTGAGTVVVGSADVTAITLTTDGSGTAEVVLPNESIATAEILNDTITFANISDSSAIDADTNFTEADGIELVLTPSYTSGDSEALLIDLNQVDDGAATDDAIAFKIEATSESGDGGDTIRGIVINYEQGVANTIMDAAIAIDNLETTAGTLTDAVIVTSSGVAAGVTDAFDASDSNIVNALNIGANLILGGDDSISIGATDDTLILTSNDATPAFTGADAAGASDTIYDTTGAGAVRVGSADVVSVTLIADADFHLINGASGNVDLAFNDYTDSADDDMDHVLLRANCTDATSGAEDCDFSIGVAEAGAAAETRFSIDADAGVNVGSANVTEVVLTAGSNTLTVGTSASTFSGGQVNVPDGTAAAPILRFTDDTNTGFYRVTTDTIGLTTAGVLAFSVSGTETTIVGTLDAQGSVWDTGGYFTIGDNSVITGTVDMQGSLWNTTGYYTVGDDVVITGTLDVRGSLWDSEGDFTIGDNVVITGTLDAQGTVLDTGGDFTVGDNMIVTGTLDVQGGDVTLQNDETIANSTDGQVTVTVTDTLAISGGGLDIQGGVLTMQNDEIIRNDQNGYIEFDVGGSDVITMSASLLDLGGKCLDLDGAGTTSICADTDNVIDYEISGADDFRMAANAFVIRAGSKISVENATDVGAVFHTQVAVTYAITTTAQSGGVIPANADVVDWYVVVYTIFDGSGADTLACGTAADDDKWVDDLDISAAGRNQAGDAADMQQDEWATSYGDIGASNVTLQCIYTDANNDAANGAATFVVFYRID